MNENSDNPRDTTDKKNQNKSKELVNKGEETMMNNCWCHIRLGWSVVDNNIQFGHFVTNLPFQFVMFSMVNDKF